MQAQRQKGSGPCTKQRFQHDIQPTLKTWHERAERLVTTWSAHAQQGYSDEPHTGVRHKELVCMTLDMNGYLMITVSGLPQTHERGAANGASDANSLRAGNDPVRLARHSAQQLQAG